MCGQHDALKRVWSKIDAECLALGNVQVRVGTLLQSSVRSLDALQLDLLLAQHSTKLVESEAVLNALFAELDKCVAALDAAISQHQGGLGSQLQARFVVVEVFWRRARARVLRWRRNSSAC